MPRTGIGEYKALSALARLKNFRAAARELGVAPSALSTTIAGLEAKLGVRLFNRTTRSVALTDVGEVFVGRITPALAEIEAAVEAVNGFRETPLGVLRINTNAVAARQIVGPIIAEYLLRFPQMRVEIVTDSDFVDIVAGGFDAGIRLSGSVPKDMIAVPIEAEERQLVVGSPSYFETHPAPSVPKDLLRHRCILGRVRSGAILPWEFEKRGRQLSLDVKGPITLDEPNLMLDAAVAGAGVAYLNETLVGDHIASGHLLCVLRDWTPPYPGISLYYPGRRQVPAGLRAFIDLIRERRRRDMSHS